MLRRSELSGRSLPEGTHLQPSRLCSLLAIALLVCSGAVQASGGCDSGYFYSKDLVSCQPCSDNCVECDGAESFCTSCADGLFLENGVCVYCRAPCVSCNNNTLTGCTACKPGFVLETGNWCVNEPSNGMVGGLPTIVFWGILLGAVAVIVIAMFLYCTYTYTMAENERKSNPSAEIESLKPVFTHPSARGIDTEGQGITDRYLFTDRDHLKDTTRKGPEGNQRVTTEKFGMMPETGEQASKPQPTNKSGRKGPGEF